MKRIPWPLVPVAALLLGLAACGGGAEPTSALLDIGEAGLSREADLPEDTRYLGLYDAGHLQREDLYYVVVEARDEAGEALSEELYAFQLHPDNFYASLWEPEVAGAQSPASYHDAENFYSLYYWETVRLGGRLYGPSCSYSFEDDMLASLSEYWESPGIDITTGEPLDE